MLDDQSIVIITADHGVCDHTRTTLSLDLAASDGVVVVPLVSLVPLFPLSRIWRENTGSEVTFFAGRQVRIVVGTGAGRGYDAYARLAARHLGRHIAGNPTFVVENMPGASGIRALNYLYAMAGQTRYYSDDYRHLACLYRDGKGL